MAKEARRQKQLAKKKAKRNEKRTQIARAQSADPTQSLIHCDRWPITFTAISESLWEDGIGHVILARRMPDGLTAFANYLVDVWCLGVKDCYWKAEPPADFRNLCERMDEGVGLREVSPEYIKKLVIEAVEYANRFGFPPHRDFRHASRLLVGIDPAGCDVTFEFGRDGVPCYVNGPYDTPERMRYISQRVAAQGGNFELIESASELRSAFSEHYDDDDDVNESTSQRDTSRVRMAGTASTSDSPVFNPSVMPRSGPTGTSYALRATTEEQAFLMEITSSPEESPTAHRRK